jgi:hypothetical protein
LKRICCFQLNLEIIPPQEQGRFLSKLTIRVRNAVKTISRNKAVYNPYNLNFGMKRSSITKSSLTGISQENKVGEISSTGNFINWAWNIS